MKELSQSLQSINCCKETLAWGRLRGFNQVMVKLTRPAWLRRSKPSRLFQSQCATILFLALRHLQPSPKSRLYQPQFTAEQPQFQRRKSHCRPTIRLKREMVIRYKMGAAAIQSTSWLKSRKAHQEQSQA